MSNGLVPEFEPRAPYARRGRRRVSHRAAQFRSKFSPPPAMTFLIVKYAVTAFVVVIVSEVAKRSDRLGAVIASLPLVTVMAMIWLHLEKQPGEKIANHAYYTFWYVLPTMPMFLLMPWMIRKGISFWVSLGAGCLLTFLCFAVAAVVLRRFGIGLMP